MHRSQWWGLLMAFGATTVVSAARAQQATGRACGSRTWRCRAGAARTSAARTSAAAPAPLAPPSAAPPVASSVPVSPAPFAGTSGAEADPKTAIASGFMVQARMQAQSSLLSLGGGPGFLVGYRGPSFALGFGLGLTRLGVTSNEGGSASASITLFQFLPTVMLDVWHSADGRARANLVGGLGYERGSVSVTSTSQSCFFNPTTGGTSCAPSSSTDSVGASLIPLIVGVGGDYFLSRNFGLGAEAGLQAAFLTGVDSSSSSGSSRSYDAGGDMELAYGVIRATIVLGD